MGFKSALNHLVTPTITNPNPHISSPTIPIHPHTNPQTNPNINNNIPELLIPRLQVPIENIIPVEAHNDVDNNRYQRHNKTVIPLDELPDTTQDRDRLVTDKKTYKPSRMIEGSSRMLEDISRSLEYGEQAESPNALMPETTELDDLKQQLILDSRRKKERKLSRKSYERRKGKTRRVSEENSRKKEKSKDKDRQHHDIESLDEIKKDKRRQQRREQRKQKKLEQGPVEQESKHGDKLSRKQQSSLQQEEEFKKQRDIERKKRRERKELRRKERERQEQERLERERLESEQKERERLERDRLELERQEREQQERERLEREQQEREQQEREARERERLERHERRRQRRERRRQRNIEQQLQRDRQRVEQLEREEIQQRLELNRLRQRIEQSEQYNQRHPRREWDHTSETMTHSQGSARNLEPELPAYKPTFHKYLDLLSFDSRFKPVIRVNKSIIKNASDLDQFLTQFNQLVTFPEEINPFELNLIDDRYFDDLIPVLLDDSNSSTINDFNYERSSASTSVNHSTDSSSQLHNLSSLRNVLLHHDDADARIADNLILHDINNYEITDRLVRLGIQGVEYNARIHLPNSF